MVDVVDFLFSPAENIIYTFPRWNFEMLFDSCVKRISSFMHVYILHVHMVYSSAAACKLPQKGFYLKCNQIICILQGWLNLCLKIYYEYNNIILSFKIDLKTNK